MEITTEIEKRIMLQGSGASFIISGVIFFLWLYLFNYLPKWILPVAFVLLGIIYIIKGRPKND